jgi:hypothetical protein
LRRRHRGSVRARHLDPPVAHCCSRPFRLLYQVRNLPARGGEVTTNQGDFSP